MILDKPLTIEIEENIRAHLKHDLDVEQENLKALDDKYAALWKVTAMPTELESCTKGQIEDGIFRSICMYEPDGSRHLEHIASQVPSSKASAKALLLQILIYDTCLLQREMLATSQTMSFCLRTKNFEPESDHFRNPIHLVAGWSHKAMVATSEKAKMDVTIARYVSSLWIFPLLTKSTVAAYPSLLQIRICLRLPRK